MNLKLLVSLPALTLICGGCAPGHVIDLGGDAGTLATDELTEAGSPSAVSGDVVGTIVDAYYGSPSPNVAVQSGTQLTQTDAAGKFTLHGLPATYDLLVGGSNSATAYFGLTTRTPVIANGPAVSLPSTARMHVTFPTPTVSDERWLVMAADDSYGTHSPDVSGELLPPDTTISWGVTPQDSITYLALGYTVSGDGSYKFVESAEETTVATNGAQLTWAPDFASVEDVAVPHGALTVPTGQTLDETYLLMRLSPRGAWAQVNIASAITSVPTTFDVPRVPGASYAIEYDSYQTGFQGSAGGAFSTAIVPFTLDASVPDATIPAPPVIASPNSLSQVGIGSTITWSGSGTCSLSFVSANDDGSPSFTLVSTGSQAAFPDFSRVGATPGHGVTYRVGLTCTAPAVAPSGDPVLQTPEQPPSWGHSSTVYELIAE
jgi:hypothetical protein